MYKYFDDLTVVEIINLLNIGLCTARVRDTVPSDIPEHNQLIDSSHLKSQKYLDSISQWTRENLMELNEKKSSAIIFNFSKKHQFTTNLLLKNKKIGIINETKLLGLILTSDLHWDKNVDYLHS